jgi:hypothetical protein
MFGAIPINTKTTSAAAAAISNPYTPLPTATPAAAPSNTWLPWALGAALGGVALYLLVRD